MKVGFGYDSHRFESCGLKKNDPQKLGGIEIEECPKLKGHSDSDVLIHAVIDAILGAAALGDIGSHFPDTDQRWDNADSAELLEIAVKEVAEAGFLPGNVDVTVICEKPKIRPYVDAMRAKLANLLRVPESSVSIKGKTNEGMGAIGEGLGIAVYAVALIDERKK